MDRKRRLWIAVGASAVAGMIVLWIANVSPGIAATIVLSAVAAWAGVRTVIQGQEELGHARDQLEIARSEAARIPDLQLAGLAFRSADSVEEVRDAVEEMAEGEREREKARRLKAQGFYPPLLRGGFGGARHHTGRIPDAVLELRLENAGQVAARSITGTVALRSDTMQIMYFPNLHIEEVSEPGAEGFRSAEVVTIPELLPGREDTSLIGLWYYEGPEVGVSRHEGRQYTLRYDFITPDGHPCHGEISSSVAG